MDLQSGALFCIKLLYITDIICNISPLTCLKKDNFFLFKLREICHFIDGVFHLVTCRYYISEQVREWGGKMANATKPEENVHHLWTLQPESCRQIFFGGCLTLKTVTHVKFNYILFLSHPETNCLYRFAEAHMLQSLLSKVLRQHTLHIYIYFAVEQN